MCIRDRDHTEAYKKMLTNIDVIKLKKVSDVLPAYKRALRNNRSTLLVELAELY